SPSYAYHQF
nr:Chain Q, SER-PRO-SER-TYR-ALA-TYR-HIS-GLN-PHE [Homo sapiens]6L9L_B Chain B, SER-PRO-SER-TYR-ALA-TYR-HIS-GLN-PHE [Homo sapiens]6L9L_F Chain F, SER-PRO-SER-TYR-ALA-TYR-HIS-GLN-PHE [Homo sapiens]6L9N_C Chain C, SER-PRO-SER-TYR-ALA-TYR-HIS-GLN-PHE [Homo sapiens]6L9N_F Chain F, SER-PRO-SER-TYR-ALA-TYR-HIS-GLN-PHE [Homo sapiens]6L9N_I Chain I, SER-PRO-SER-TYR-ALA-TYR-HIS-GLN-PHE [Homo sapiens]6L9N_L Chain L, SER-PRO-SER-TYR-ALA-TYR-HIS-GLN-PHE [Homo sapiens]